MMKAALAGAAFFLSAGLAVADPVAPAVLVPALDLYVDTEVAAHNSALSCAEANSPARDEGAWRAATAVFIATLWANGFPADFVASATARFAAPPLPVDCTDDNAFTLFGEAENDGWRMALRRTLDGLELTAVTEPVSGDAWSRIKAAIGDEEERQRRLFECIGVTYPSLMPVMVHDWDAMIVKIGGKLVAAGLPHDQITTVLSAAEAGSLWQRVEADKVADVRKSCDGDQEWQTRFNNFAFLSLGSTIDSLLPQPPPDSDP
jgi:hypothetical protein